ncbi:unnamed protein product [Discosporangium mesarthrocarpum]
MSESGDMLRALRREIGAPTRPQTEPSGGGASRRSVGGGRGSVNSGDMSSLGFLERGEEPEDGPGHDHDEMVFFDPVWGQPDYEPGHRTTAAQIFGVMCCPCFMGKDGFWGAKNQAVWKRIRHRAAVVTCAIDLIVFVLSIIINGGFQPMWGTPDSNPLLGPSAQTLVVLGAKHLGLIQQGQVWRLLTPMLLHGGVLHMFMNMVSQFRMGTFLEELWGTRTWLIIYWVGGLGGNLLSCAASPNKVGVGASGAIYAIMGGWLSHVLCTWNEEDAFNKVAQLVQVVAYTLVGMAMSLAPIVDWAAHLGGLLSGVMLGWVFFCKPLDESRHMLREPVRKKIYRLQGRVCMGVMWVIMVFLGYWSLFQSVSTIPLSVESPAPK